MYEFLIMIHCSGSFDRQAMDSFAFGQMKFFGKHAYGCVHTFWGVPVFGFETAAGWHNFIGATIKIYKAEMNTENSYLSR